MRFVDGINGVLMRLVKLIDSVFFVFKKGIVSIFCFLSRFFFFRKVSLVGVFKVFELFLIGCFKVLTFFVFLSLFVLTSFLSVFKGLFTVINFSLVGIFKGFKIFLVLFCKLVLISVFICKSFGVAILERC